jgi:GTP-binding protein
MLGLPNAGKSSFIRSVSSAEPKVADYPFTTIIPSLGVVKVGQYRSFVVADIPGLIEGASDGAGLGVRFLKHLTRCRILAHLVDLCPADGSCFIDNAKSIIAELERFSPALAERERWLVLNKTDLLLDEEVEEKKQEIIAALNWTGPIYAISAINRDGTPELCEDLLGHLEGAWEAEREDSELAEKEIDKQKQMQKEAREHIRALREKHYAEKKGLSLENDDEDEDDDDDDYDVEVEYVQ